jgi:hypothetical protein
LSSAAQDALTTLARTRTPDVSLAPSPFDLRHIAYPLVGAGILSAGGSAAEGRLDPAHLTEEALTGAALGYGLHRGGPALVSRYMQGPEQQRAIAAAQSALSTGLKQSPVLPDAPFRDALRSLIFGQGAAGAY